MAALAFTGLLAADLVQSGQLAALSVLFILLAWLPLLALHELGHALVARLLGWSVLEWVVGVGPPLLRTRVGQARVWVNWIPVSGYVIPVPRDGTPARLQQALIYLAGPGVELLLVAGIYFALGPERLLARTDDVALLAAQALCVAACLGAALNLVPLPMAGGMTDGLGMLASLFTPRAQFEQRARLPFLLQMELCLDGGDPHGALAVVRRGLERFGDSGELLAAEAVCRAALGEREAALQSLQALHDRSDLDRWTEAQQLHAAARVVLLGGAPELLSEAESACKSALELGGPELEVELTLAQVHLQQGRHGLALERLSALYTRVRRPAQEDRVLAYLVIAHHAAGDLPKARLYDRTLRRRRPSAHLLRLVTDRCGPLSPGAPQAR